MVIEVVNNLDSIDPEYNMITDNSQTCEYYSIEDFANICCGDACLQNFLLLNFNIRSFHSNCDNFHVFLESIPNLPDVFILTETFNNCNNVSLYNVQNYNASHTYRENSRGGGVSAFVHEKFCSINISEVS